jgi:hypothetical protein
MAVTAEHDNNQAKEKLEAALGPARADRCLLISAPTFKLPD